MTKRIGIIGGLSPESTIEYYRSITHSYFQRFGNFAYPEILIYSVSFQEYADWPKQDRWDLVAQGLSHAAQRLEAAGADFILISANTMHIVFDQVQECVKVPMLSLLDAVAEAINARGFQKVGLLGTRFTMEKPFYRDALVKKGIEVIVPETSQDRDLVNRVIYDELVAGKILPESRQAYLEVISRLAQRGAQAVILGCTEIPLLVSEADAGMPLFDTTAIHVEKALEWALK